MLSDIISDTLDDDMEIVTSVSDRSAIVPIAARSEADVVILGLADGELPMECVGLFEEHPQIKVVGVVDRGRQVFLYELRPHRSSLGEVSPRELVAVIRRAIAGDMAGSAGTNGERGRNED
jgi:DNA-binding NarL/FixJ family response regulator